MNDVLIHATKLTRRYNVGKAVVPALSDVELLVPRGEFTALVGPSGSGKSTLLNLIGGLDRPSGGEIRVNGLSLGGATEAELVRYRRERVGFIFQSFNLVSVLSVLQNVELPLLLQRTLNARERRERVLALLDRVGIREYSKHRPSELSGGQRQRVAIARALVTRPKLVLADEPTANLDSVTGTNILNLMKELNQSEKTTFIFSTHDARVWAYASAVVRLADGQIQDRVSAEEAVRAGGLPAGRPA